MNENISSFLHQQTCASVCCIDEQGYPYCFSCYFSFNSADGLLYFKSSTGSRHAAMLKNNPMIAGTVLPDKLNTLLVKGIQFDGRVLPANHPLALRGSIYYHKRFPLALAVHGETMTIMISNIKMTDSTRGFGKKINWCREELLAELA